MGAGGNGIVMRIAVVMTVLLAACATTPEGGGERLFARNCISCHGATGAGDGPKSAGLPVPPANLRGLAAGNDGIFPTERVMAAIYGYPGKAHAGTMPEFARALAGPTVLWETPDGEKIETPVSLVELARYLETLQEP